jgi:hypothetical protein
MRFDSEFDTLILSPMEFETLGNHLAGKRNELSLLVADGSGRGDQGKVLKEFESLKGVDRGLLTSAFLTLGEPLSVAALHYSVADHSLTRSYLAWPMGEDEPLAVLTRRSDDFALTTRSKSEIQNLLANLLAVEQGLISANLAVDLSAITTLVALGFMDAFRFAHLQSMLSHTAPPQSYSVEEVMERIRVADKEDFRWPLLFYEKILPNGTLQSIQEKEVLQAFEVLEEAGVLLSLVDEVESSNLAFYTLSDAGALIADGLLHEASKVAMCVSRMVGESEIGHEALLFVRDSNYLWLFDVSGREGTIASLDAEIWSELVQQLLHPETVPLGNIEAGVEPTTEEKVVEDTGFRSAATVMQSELDPQVLRCPKCAALVKPGKRFCPACGASLE